MAKVSRSSSKKPIYELTSWNFIVFLTLAFVLLVLVARAMTNTADDVRAKAGLTCPDTVKISDLGQCDGGWKLLTINGCSKFVCEIR